MSERITEAAVAELLGIDTGPLPPGGILDQQFPYTGPRLRAIIEDWRRLRGLIVDAHGNVEHVTMTPLEAEARAIREESLVSVWPDASGSGRDLTASGPHRPTSVGAGLPLYAHHPDDRAPTLGEPRLTFNEEVMGKIVRVWVNGRPFVPAIREEGRCQGGPGHDDPDNSGLCILCRRPTDG